MQRTQQGLTETFGTEHNGELFRDKMRFIV